MAWCHKLVWAWRPQDNFLLIPRQTRSTSFPLVTSQVSSVYETHHATSATCELYFPSLFPFPIILSFPVIFELKQSFLCTRHWNFNWRLLSFKLCNLLFVSLNYRSFCCHESSSISLFQSWVARAWWAISLITNINCNELSIEEGRSLSKILRSKMRTWCSREWSAVRSLEFQSRRPWVHLVSIRRSSFGILTYHHTWLINIEFTAVFFSDFPSNLSC